MEDYSPSTYESSDNVYSEQSYQQTAVRELPPQEYQDEENEKVDKPVKEDNENNKNNKNQIKSALKKYWWIIAVLVVLAGGVTIIRPWESAPEEKNASQVAKFSVRTTKAQTQPIRAWASSEGRVRAARYKHLTFEIEGDVTYLARRNGRRLREGDRVKSGELLARVDDRKLVADVRQAEAAIAEARKQRAAARANVAQAKAQVSTARSQLQKAQTARNLAATNLERYRLLINEGAIARQEFDTRQNAVRDAEADVGAAQSQVESAQAGVISAQEQLEATSSSITTAEARLTQAKVALEGASIYAPFNGIVAYLNYTEGEYFTPQAVSSQLGGDYQGILERIPMVVIDPSLYEVIVDLAAPTGEQVNPGQPAYVASETNVRNSLSGNTVNQTLVANARAKGEVFAVNPAISPGGRAIEARIRLNPSTTQTVRHGERVLTWIAVEQEPNAIVVPLNTVVYRDQIPYVFVVNREGIVEKRKVELGIRGITQQQIISGVQAGESVVTQGQNRLVNGAPVRVVSNE